MNNVTVIDYGCGNILSLSRAIEACGTNVILTRDPELILNAQRLVLPGVGAFGHCASKLNEYGIFEVLREYINRGKPVLGICVGMQMLMSESLEYGEHDGLNYIAGEVRKIGQENRKKKVPFIGWAKLELVKHNHSLVNFQAFENEWFYFVHSYAANPSEPETLVGFYQYDCEKVTAIIAKNNVIGCQFHPEKSGVMGLKFLEKFLQS